MLIGTYHSVIIYFFAYIVWKGSPVIYREGFAANFLCFGTFMIHNVVVLVNVKLLIEATYKSYIFIVSIILSIFGFMGTTFLYNLFNM
jgi:phospholipid-translocating ATPase